MKNDKPLTTPEDAIELGEDAMGRNEAERKARRDTLKSMLQVTEARVQRARRGTKPVLAIGYQVRIRTGEHAGQSGLILDADFINNRVLVETGKDEPAVWLSFDHVDAVPDNC